MDSVSMDGFTVTLLDLGIQNGSLYYILTVSVLFLTLAVLSLLLFYLKMARASLKEKEISALKKRYWDESLSSYLKREKETLKIASSEGFRDHLIEKVEEEKFERSDIIEIYENYGFIRDDSNLIESGEWWEKTEAMNRMKTLNINKEEELVSRFLLHEKEEVRLAALDMLAEVKSETLYHKITDIFDVNSDDLIEYIILKLFRADIPPMYFQPLFISDEDKLRLSAAVMIGKEGNEDAIPLLNSLSDDPVEEVRLEAIRSLGRTNLEEAISILKNKINDESKRVRAAVAKAIRRISSARGVWILEELLKDPEYEVRLQAYLALRKFGKEGIQITQTYEDKDPIAAQEAIMRSVFVKGARIDA